MFTDRFELVYVKDGDNILFDRVEDPQQKANVFGKEAYRTEVERMTAAIIGHCERFASPELEWLRERLRSLTG